VQVITGVFWWELPTSSSLKSGAVILLSPEKDLGGFLARIFPNEAAQAVVSDLVRKAKQSVYDASPDLYKNKVDPFSALIDSMLQGIPLSNWIAQEKVRQSQKTLQNCIGDFHQSVIASFDGWEDLGTGQIIDIRNKKQKVVAEIKNKYNTTKGNARF
jgi:hypothetical protein